MQFISISRRRTEQFSESQFVAMVEAEARQARKLYADGFIRQIWHRGDQGGACLLIEAANVEEVQATLQTLPMVAAGMLEVSSIVPLCPYRGFAGTA